jgi:predicted DNA-binding protein
VKKQPDDATINIRLPLETRRELKARLDREGETISAFLRRHIEAYLRD